MDFLNFFNSVLPLVGGIFAIVVTIGAVLAFRQSYTKQVALMQQQMITLKDSQIKMLHDEIDELKKEVQRQKRLMLTARYAFKQQGLQIKINGEAITLYNRKTGRTKIIPIQVEEQKVQKREEEELDGEDEENE